MFWLVSRWWRVTWVGLCRPIATKATKLRRSRVCLPRGGRLRSAGLLREKAATSLAGHLLSHPTLSQQGLGNIDQSF
ncbi:hypothetical protein B0T21DRAFT_171420 [Apiosordaria backusii]|uniref:Secreted protein n=1 Tax=Apiosordaria backusii TaxID=314023 RepID=A0AA40EC15_9PEZI|nr:hypothetical protein B0T21DRAFT_171420 [Apiosordaria backusii]